MIASGFRLTVLAGKQLIRHKVRTLLTLSGIAAGMFLYAAITSLQQSLDHATSSQAADTTLVVYRENRFCPSTSRLPEYYENEIRALEGVREVIPVKITVNNCGASLDVITFRGVPTDTLFSYAPEISLLKGSLSDWKTQDDGALVGRHFAARRGLGPGDAFEAAGVRVQVSGIIDSPHPQDNNVAYVHLPFLQQTSRSGLGVVTQFNVRVTSPDLTDEVATRIDERFRAEAEPTFTQAENAFIQQTAGDLIELAGFTRWIGLGAVLAVFGLVANAILLVVRSRIRENAVLRTLGYPSPAIVWLVLSEGALLGLAGGLLGCAASLTALHWSRITMGSEGIALSVNADPKILLTGSGLALGLGLLASLWPAWTAIRRPIVESLRR
jgi:putative ABC transport system permease protein